MINDSVGNVNTSNHQQINERSQQNLSGLGASKYNVQKKSNKKNQSHMKDSYNANVNEADNVRKERFNKKTQNEFNEHSKSHNNSVTTKVKSGSWKRSEKSVALSNKKHKTQIWLKFSNSKIKKTDLNQLVRLNELTSACIPGTSYSDVLFGAGSSNLVKNKNYITPSICNHGEASNSSQNKISKAFFKYNENQENATSDESDVEEKKNMLPALQKNKNIFLSSTPKNDNFDKSLDFGENFSNSQINTNTSSSAKSEAYGEADVVILSDFKELSLAENNVSYGNYLEQNFQHLSGIISPDAKLYPRDNKFLSSAISNIPKWNFMNLEMEASEAFPKFLCQFDDENYLKAEKMALLSLKLALGNNNK